MHRYMDLQLLEQAGQIRELKCQVPIALSCGGTPVLTQKGNPMHYRADFKYWDVQAREMVYEDVKGHMTQLAELKLAMVKAEHGIEVRIVRR